MYLIGLTGGIASGKSTVAARLTSWGAVHLDVDQFARDAVDPRSEHGAATLDQVVREFGPKARASDGRMDRRYVADRIFSDAGARQRLNDIVHPAIRAVSDRELAEVGARQPDAFVVYEASLLAESRQRLPFDIIVTTSAPAAVQIDRLVKTRRMTAAAAQKRLLTQASDEDRRAIADIVVDTGGLWMETERELVDLWVRLRALRMVG